MRIMIRRAALAITFGLVSAAAAQQRPECSSATRGMIWPQGPLNTERSRRCDEVSQCSRGVFAYRWRVVRLPYWKYSQSKTPEACRGEAAGSPPPAQPDPADRPRS